MNACSHPSSAEETNPTQIAGNRIKKLPPLLINQLAAGEVVTRPASVVKELMENAIDAGAREITVRITQGGMGIIEVSDDGCGIHPDDMVMAVTRYATSKIADVAHLQGIATLGFRGEALAATAAVSRLTLMSSHDESGIGRELTVAGILEDTPELTPVLHPQGTTVTVKDLYFNVPARRGNLKSIATEFAHIETVVKQLALVASDVKISLWHNDKRRYCFDAITSSTERLDELSSMAKQSGLLQQVLARLQVILPDEVLLSSQMSNSSDGGACADTPPTLCPVSIPLAGLVHEQTADFVSSAPHRQRNGQGKDRADIGVFGVLMPSMSQGLSTAYKLIYINGRLVKDRRIAQCMRESAEGAGVTQLGYVLFFELPQAWLNLNVHPSKQSIKVQNLANIMAHLAMSIRSQLQQWRQQISQRTDTSIASMPTSVSQPVSPYADHYQAHDSLGSSKSKQLKTTTDDKNSDDKHSHLQDNKLAYNEFATCLPEGNQPSSDWVTPNDSSRHLSVADKPQVYRIDSHHSSSHLDSEQKTHIADTSLQASPLNCWYRLDASALKNPNSAEAKLMDTNLSLDSLPSSLVMVQAFDQVYLCDESLLFAHLAQVDDGLTSRKSHQADYAKDYQRLTKDHQLTWLTQQLQAKYAAIADTYDDEAYAVIMQLLSDCAICQITLAQLTLMLLNLRENLLPCQTHR